MNNTIKYATKQLIDSIWTLAYIELEDKPGYVEIISYDRESKIGYERHKELLKVTLTEDENRVITDIQLYPSGYSLLNSDILPEKTLKVINPKHIFDYS